MAEITRTVEVSNSRIWDPMKLDISDVKVRIVSVVLPMLVLFSIVATTGVHASGGVAARVDFCVPSGTPVIPGPDGDTFVAMEQTLSFTLAVGCAFEADAHPIQIVRVVPGRAGPHPAFDLAILITCHGTPGDPPCGVSQTTPLPTGTRIGDLVGNGSCSANGNFYDKYYGIAFL